MRGSGRDGTKFGDRCRPIDAPHTNHAQTAHLRSTRALLRCRLRASTAIRGCRPEPASPLPDRQLLPAALIARCPAPRPAGRGSAARAPRTRRRSGPPRRCGTAARRGRARAAPSRRSPRPGCRPPAGRAGPVTRSLSSRMARPLRLHGTGARWWISADVGTSARSSDSGLCSSASSSSTLAMLMIASKPGWNSGNT